MKKIVAFSFLMFFASMVIGCSETTDPQKLIIGSWVNPYTYESTGEFKGFKFDKGGKCSAINIPSLELETWEIKNGRLIIKGNEINSDTGGKSVYESSEPIDLLNKDTLMVVAIETPKSCFLYINQKNYDKK